jgi:hypothetical protein
MDFLVHMKAAKHDHGHQTVPSDLTLRVKALESLLAEKGLVDPAALDALIDTYEHKVWYKSAPYRSRAVIDPRGVLREFGLDLPRMWKYVFGTAQRKYVGPSAVSVMGVERSCLIWQTPALSVA